MHIGRSVKQIRLSKNLKQSAVAAAIGMSVTAYSDIEREKTTHITLLRLEQIASVLGVPVSVIILAATDNTTSHEHQPVIGK